MSRLVGGSALWTACGDFNGDGRIDVSVGGNEHITTFYTQADGTLPLSPSTTATSGVADLDGNGYDDIAVAAGGGPNLDVFYAVPEPGAVTLLAPAALTLLTRRRRRNDSM